MGEAAQSLEEPQIARPDQPAIPLHDWEMSIRDWAAVLGASLGAFMAILDIQITNASLREIQGSLGLDFSEGGWISTSYLIAEIIVIPLTAFFSKVFGMRKYILANCAVFILASILCGFSWNLTSMITFRILQGLSGGTLIPMAFQTMLLFMPPHKKTLGLAIFGMTATLAPTLGPSLGGWLTDNYGWRANFFINVIPGLLMMWTIHFGMPVTKIKLELLKKISLSSLLTLVMGLGTLTYILEEGARFEWFEDDAIKICFLIALAALPLFVVIQILSKSALLNLKLFTNKNFCISAVITMMSGVALYGGIYALSLYLGQIQNYSAQQIGSVMMWVGIPQLFVMPLLPFLMKKVDLRLLAVIGMFLFAFSNFMNTHLSMDYSGAQFRLSLIIRAIGQPLFMIPLSTIGMALILPSEAGNAASIYNVMRNLGGSLGIALTGTFIISRQNLHLSNNLEHLTPYDPVTIERLTMIQRGLMSSGIDVVTAKTQALKMVALLAQRESLIQSFSDIFFFLTVGLSLCIILCALLGKLKVSKDNVVSEMH